MSEPKPMVCVSALNDDFEAWTPMPSDPHELRYLHAIGAVAGHLTANPPPHELVPHIHVELYPAEGARLIRHYELAPARYANA